MPNSVYPYPLPSHPLLKQPLHWKGGRKKFLEFNPDPRAIAYNVHAMTWRRVRHLCGVMKMVSRDVYIVVDEPQVGIKSSC